MRGFWSKRPYLLNEKVLSRHKLALIRVGLTLCILVVGLMPLAANYLRPPAAHAASSLAYNYTKTFDTSANGASANAVGVATDSLGNVYVTGDWSGTVVFDGVGGHDSQTSTGDDIFLTKYNADGSYGWTKVFDTSTTYGFAEATAIATDGSGNVYITGNWVDTVVFDGVGGTDSQTTNATTTFLTKYNADGSYGWTKIFDSSSNGFSLGNGVTTDGSGNIYVVGDWAGITDFDGVGGNDTQTTPNNSTFLTKYNADGSYAWTKVSDDIVPSSNPDSAVSVVTDSGGNIYVTGGFQGTLTFDGVGGLDTQTSINSTGYLTKYNANGSYSYTKYFDTSSGALAAPNSVTTDSNGNIYEAGTFYNGAVIFDGVGGSDSQGSINLDSYLTKYNADGSYAYTKIFDTSGAGGGANSLAVATDNTGNIYLTGWFSGTVVFDGIGGSDSQTMVNSSAYLTKYNSDGSYAYTKFFDTSASTYGSQGNGVAIASNGNVYLAGPFYGTVTFSGVGGCDTETADNGNSGSYLTSFKPGLTSDILTSSAGTGGSVSPSGELPISHLCNQVITVTPSNGYHYGGYSSNGQVSCTPSGIQELCTISNISSDLFFTANFVANSPPPSHKTPSLPPTPQPASYTITSSVQGNGSITPAGDTSVVSGASQTYTITPDLNNTINSVLVDGTNEGSISTYTFTNVTTAHTIEAVFSANSTPTPVNTSSTTPTKITPPKPSSNPLTVIGHSVIATTHFVNVIFNKIPEPVAVGFPWLLLLLLLLMTIWALRQAYREAKTVQFRTSLLKEQKQLAETKDTFLQLATHYLATPLAKLQGGVELLASTSLGLDILPNLQSQTEDISEAAKKLLNTLNPTSSEATVSSTSTTTDKIIGQARRRLWLLAVTIGVLVYLIDFFYHGAKHIKTSTLAQITHIAIFILLSLVLYGALRYYRIQHQKNVATRNLISTEQNLDHSRQTIIGNVYRTLVNPLTALDDSVQDLDINSPAGKGIAAGISEYHSILDKLKTVLEIDSTPLSDTRIISLLSVLQPATSALNSKIDSKHLSVSYAPGIADQRVLADPNMLSKVVAPILDNAVKFSPVSGAIVIGYQPGINTISLSIKDNGQGIDKSYMDRLFKPFSRAERNALTYDHEGVGLSLYVAKLVAQTLHGDITLESAKDKGTTVYIKLPKPSKETVKRAETDQQHRQQRTVTNSVNA